MLDRTSLIKFTPGSRGEGQIFVVFSLSVTDGYCRAASLHGRDFYAVGLAVAVAALAPLHAGGFGTGHFLSSCAAWWMRSRDAVSSRQAFQIPVKAWARSTSAGL